MLHVSALMLKEHRNHITFKCTHVKRTSPYIYVHTCSRNVEIPLHVSAHILKECRNHLTFKYLHFYCNHPR